MPKHIKYSPNVKKSFVTQFFERKFADTSVMTPAQQKQRIFNIANDCREWYSPIFSNETKYLNDDINNVKQSLDTKDLFIENSDKGDVLYMKVSDNYVPKSSENLTTPPIKKKDYPYVKAALVGVGVALLTKILIED